MKIANLMQYGGLIALGCVTASMSFAESTVAQIEAQQTGQTAVDAAIGDRLDELRGGRLDEILAELECPL